MRRTTRLGDLRKLGGVHRWVRQPGGNERELCVFRARQGLAFLSLTRAIPQQHRKIMAILAGEGG